MPQEGPRRRPPPIAQRSAGKRRDAAHNGAHNAAHIAAHNGAQHKHTLGHFTIGVC